MNRITQLFGIKYPIVQGGMVWCSGWELASAELRWIRFNRFWFYVSRCFKESYCQM